MKVRFLVPAEIEMFEAAAFYEMQASALGGNFLDIVEETIIVTGVRCLLLTDSDRLYSNPVVTISRKSCADIALSSTITFQAEVGTFPLGLPLFCD